MVERKYRKWGSMKNAKEMKSQVEDATLLYLEHRSYVGRQTQVSYGKAIDDLCRDFQGLLREHQKLLAHYKNLLDTFIAKESGDPGQPGQVESSGSALPSSTPTPIESALLIERKRIHPQMLHDY